MREVIEMYQQFPWNTPYQQRPQQQWYQPPQPPSVVMVTSKAEVDAAQIPFDPGVTSVFVDMSHGMVYTKRFNPQTGGADLDVYTRQNAPVAASTPDPVTAQLADLVKRVEALEANKEVVG